MVIRRSLAPPAAPGQALGGRSDTRDRGVRARDLVAPVERDQDRGRPFGHNRVGEQPGVQARRPISRASSTTALAAGRIVGADQHAAVHLLIEVMSRDVLEGRDDGHAFAELLLDRSHGRTPLRRYQSDANRSPLNTAIAKALECGAPSPTAPPPPPSAQIAPHATGRSTRARPVPEPPRRARCVAPHDLPPEHWTLDDPPCRATPI